MFGFFNMRKPAPVIDTVVELYRPNDNFTNITSCEAAELSIVLAINPLYVHGYKKPEGLFIAPSQYEKLSDTVAKYFDKQLYTLERL